MPNSYFLHGLESSGRGTKGRFFAEFFPEIIRPDFTGSLAKRLLELKHYCRKQNDLLFIGSSYGGLMATHFAIQFPTKIRRLILLAPALNFEGFTPPLKKLDIPTTVIIGKNDEVTPVDPVISLARQTYATISVEIVADDHMLHNTFKSMDWKKLLSC
jgi:pimeloyl-ACP methyl ester carboxylesterase